MCGIAGLWSGQSPDLRERLVSDMVGSIRHRGPDGQGVIHVSNTLTFGHVRLAIQDTSASAAQPMYSRSGRFALVYNGEIYNHHELRAELPRQAYRGTGDTETLLAGFEHFGVRRTLGKLNGMFAMGIWDTESQLLTLARDRFGIKPLYFGELGTQLVFASDLKAIQSIGKELRIDSEALSGYFRFGCVPHSLCIYDGIHKVQPATALSFRAPVMSSATTERYWELVGGTPSITEYREAMTNAEGVLQDAVTSRLLSDVSLGVFLSGGIDSSVVAALAQRATAGNIQTFSMGFADAGLDESPHAAKIAAHLGTDHQTFHVSDADALAVVPQMATVYTEPFSDSSQIPMLLLAKETRRSVTVALSGDGGDEVFAGYNRHILGPRIWRVLKHLSPRGRKGFQKLAGQIGGRRMGRLLAAVAGPRWMTLPQQKLAKMISVLGSRDVNDMYDLLTDCWSIPPLLDRRRFVRPTNVIGANVGESFRRWDLQGYLLHDILVKVDRATMAVGLEARVPFLDHNVVEFGFATPHNTHIKHGAKGLLRDVLARLVPRDLFERPKAGFAVPLARWLRGPLRDWAEAVLSRDSMLDLGIDEAVVRKGWSDLLAGSQNQHKMWAVIMLLSWYQEAGQSGTHARLH